MVIQRQRKTTDNHSAPAVFLQMMDAQMHILLEKKPSKIAFSDIIILN
jgi:hypothetical protein